MNYQKSPGIPLNFYIFPCFAYVQKIVLRLHRTATLPTRAYTKIYKATGYPDFRKGPIALRRRITPVLL